MSSGDVDDLKTALRVAGIDATGLDLPWLAAFKRTTEERIARARREEGFDDARPLFAPPVGPDRR